MKIRKINLNNIMLFLIIFLCMIGIQGLSFVTKGELSIPEMSITFSVIAIFSIFYFFIERKNKMKIYPIFIFILFVFLIASIVTNIFLPTTYELAVINTKGDLITYIAEIESSTKIINVFSTSLLLYSIYLFVVVLPQKIYLLKQLSIIFCGMIIVILVAVIYSFIHDAEGYVNLFKGYETSRIEIVSFTNNANNYAGLLFFGIVSSIYMHHLTRKFIYYIPVGVFLVSMFPTLSRTYIVSAFVLVFGYLLIRAIFEFKKHKLKVILSSSIILSVFLAISISYSVCLANGIVNNFPPFIILNLFFERFTQGLNGRENVWRQTTSLISYTNTWAFGMGFRIFDTVFYKLQYSAYTERAISSPDNGFIQVIIDGGVALALLIAFLVLYAFVISIKIFKKHKKLFCLNTLLLVIFIFQMAFESAAILAPGLAIINYCMMSTLVFVPTLSTYRKDKKENSEFAVEPLEKLREETLISKCSKTSAFVLTLGYIVTLILLPSYRSNTTLFILFMIFAHSFIVAPLIIQLIDYKNFKIKNYLLETLFPYTFMAVLLTLISHLIISLGVSSGYMIVLLLIFSITLYTFSFTCLKPLRVSNGYINDLIYITKKLYKKIFLNNKKTITSNSL